jgi:HSP20 family molecular chaperone IbpA
VTASYRDGILQITVALPAKEETQPKKIPIAHPE